MQVLQRKNKKEASEELASEDINPTTLSGEADNENLKKRKRRKKAKDLEEKIREPSSKYLSKRKLGRAVKRVARANRSDLLILAMAILVVIIFIFASAQESVGNFTINLNKLDMYNRGISLSETSDFASPKSRLKANQVANATNISNADLPGNLNNVDGSHNGDDYMAYTFYIRNGGKENVDYITAIVIGAKAKNTDAAIRVKVYKNGKPTIYAKPKANGHAEPNTVAFVSEDTVMEGLVEGFAVGQVDKYTIVIWLDGDDPDCTDNILGGMVRLGMNIRVLDPEEKQKIDYQEE